MCLSRSAVIFINPCPEICILKAGKFPLLNLQGSIVGSNFQCLFLGSRPGSKQMRYSSPSSAKGAAQVENLRHSKGLVSQFLLNGLAEVYVWAAATFCRVRIVCALVHALFRPQTKTHFEDTFLSGRVRERRREDTFRRHIKRRRISPRRRITPRRHISKTH